MGHRSPAPSFSTAIFPTSVLNELKTGGFVEIQPGMANQHSGRVVANELLEDFTARAHALRRYHLLAGDQPSELAAWVNHVYFTDQLLEVLWGVLCAGGIDERASLDDILRRYVVDHQWPAWVAASLNEPMADRILAVVSQAKSPIPLAGLAGHVAISDPNRVRIVIDKLIARMALFEDLRKSSWELIVGVLPTVRKSVILASMPRERPPLEEVETPREYGPDGSPVVNDIRAVLLEIASQPPRLRQDHALFHKEIARFQTALDPLPDWLLHAMKWSPDGRMNRAITWARVLGLARIELEANQLRLHVSPEGDGWLSDGAREDDLKIYDQLRSFESKDELYSEHLGLFLPGLNPWDYGGTADVYFLGSHIAALRVEKGRRPAAYWRATPAHYLAFRNQLDSSLSVLKVGVFYRLDTVESHIVFDKSNPLNLGLPPDEVAVFFLKKLTPADRPDREEIGRQAINAFVLQRLVPFGCMQAARDDSGRICIAQVPGSTLCSVVKSRVAKRLTT